MDDEQINNDLIEATLALVDRDFEPDGAVLIFLPGLQACGPDAPLRRGCAAAARSLIAAALYGALVSARHATDNVQRAADQMRDATCADAGDHGVVRVAHRKRERQLPAVTISHRAAALVAGDR